MSIGRLVEAASVVEFDDASIDLPLLVGALAMIKQWAASESELKARGGTSLCERIRTEGQRLLNEAEESIEPEPELVLRIYRTSSGQWAGKLFSGEDEVGGMAGCNSPQEVEQAAQESGIYPDRIEIEGTKRIC